VGLRQTLRVALRNPLIWKSEMGAASAREPKVATNHIVTTATGSLDELICCTSSSNVYAQ
jgi:hypothetical protein